MKSLIALLFLLPALAMAQDTTNDSTLAVSFEPPTTRVDGQPLSADEIANYRLTCGQVDTLIPGSTEDGSYEVERADVLPGYGKHACSLVVIDTDGLESLPSDSVTVPWEKTSPSKPTSLIIIIS